MDQNEMEAPKKNWGKRIAIFFGVLVVLLVAVFFVATSGPFIKSVILPKAGAAMNAKITAGDVSLSPFSQLYVRQLKIETTGAEPLLTADEVRVRYSLMDILKGNINVNEITVNTPVVTVVQNPDGSSNLDPLTKGGGSSKTSKSSEPIKLLVQNVSLKNGTVRQMAKDKNGSSKTTELKNLAVDLDRLGNGQTGHLKLSSSFGMQQQQGGTNSLLAGDFSGGYDIALNQALLPEVVKGALKLAVARADGSFKDLAGLNSTLDADLTPKEIRQVALRFAKGEQPLGQVRVSGPLDIDRKEGTLRVEVSSIDKNVLALAAGGTGYDFGNTHINSTNVITIAQGGTFFSTTGLLAGASITLAKDGVKTPEMNLNVDYDVAVNNSAKTAQLQRLNLAGSSGGREFLRSELERQMNLSWGEKVQGYRDAAMRLIVTNFNLAEWRPVLGTNITSGTVNATVSLGSQQDGRLLNADVRAGIENLVARFGSNALENAGVTFETTANIEQMKTVNVPRYALALRQNNTPVAQASGTARYVLESKDTTAQLSLEGALPRLLALAAMPDARASAGSLKANVQYNDAGGKRSAVGNLALNEFTGGFQNYGFTNFAAGLEYNVDTTPTEVTINRAAMTFAQGFSRGGAVDLKGKYNLENKSGQFAFSGTDLNQNTFGPLLAPSLGDNKLVSITMNASGDAKLDPAGESALKAQVKVANWVVQDPAGTMPKTPLAVDLSLDGSMAKEVLNLRQLLVQLSETPRAKNALQLQAKLDLSKTNPGPSTLSLTSDSFDLTPYYDLFASKPDTAKTATTPQPAPAAVPPQEQKEPEPMSLPFQQLTANLKIDRLFLREVAISNWVGKVSIQSNVVELSPFELRLNGGPVAMNGKVDVGRKGYAYNLGFKADSVPLAPLANTFSAQSNSLEGTFVADATIRGEGITGPSLRRNLGGNANFNLTNLNYQIVGPKLRRILVPISVALRVPELLQTPINWVAAQTEIGNGQVDLKHLGVESAAFYAESAGKITLADVLTNSALNLPIDLSLNRTLAQKTGLLSSETATNAQYAKLPQFVTVKGTVGAPDPDINKLVLAGMVARGAAAFGLGNATTEKALGTVGSLLTGQKGSTNGLGTNAPTLGSVVQGVLSATGKTNAASTNSAVGNVVQSLGGLLSNRQNTNAAAQVSTNANTAVTNAVQNALDSLFRSRQKK